MWERHSHITRRRLLGGVVTVGIVGPGTAGCLGDDAEASVESAPGPIALDDGRECDVCGMIIEGGYGPNGQVVYDGDYPPERGGPARYDSVRELYVDAFGQMRRGIDPVATFVTDYATVEFDVETQDGERYITGSTEPETFVEAGDAVFVVDSGIRGAMGTDLLPFGRRDAAEAFVEEHGGEIVDGDVTAELVE